MSEGIEEKHEGQESVFLEEKKNNHKLTVLNPRGGFMDSRRSVEQEARAAMRDQPLEG